MKTRIIKILFISLLFSTKIFLAAEMEEAQDPPLMDAIHAEESLKKIRSLIDNNGADVSGRDRHNQTPLMVAACNEQLDVVNYLLEQNANPHEETLDGCSVFCFAANPEIQAVLEKNGVEDPHLAAAAMEKNPKTPLIDAINEEKPLNKIRSIIDRNSAHVNERDGHSQTALMVATCYKQLGVVKSLLAGNANPHEKTSDGCSAFCFSADPKIRTVLAKKGVENPHLAAADEKSSNAFLVLIGLLSIASFLVFYHAN